MKSYNRLAPTAKHTYRIHLLQAQKTNCVACKLAGRQVYDVHIVMAILATIERDARSVIGKTGWRFVGSTRHDTNTSSFLVTYTVGQRIARAGPIAIPSR